MKEFKRLQFQDYLIRINVADMFNQQRPDSKRRSDREMSAQEMLAEVHENEKICREKTTHTGACRA